ncbi:MAG: phage tail protein, partial [Paracoccaceae bacterium]
TLIFKMRNGQGAVELNRTRLALSTDLDASVEQMRRAEAEVSGRVRLRFVQADAAFDALAEEAVLADEKTHSVATSEIPLALTRVEGRQVVERWLTEARIGRDTIRFALPPSMLSLGAGDVVSLDGEQQEGQALYRIDRVEQGALQVAEAVRIDPEIYVPSDLTDEVESPRAFVPPVPVLSFFLDLPLITGDEAPYAPYIAATAQPWPGSVAVFQSPSESDYQLLNVISARSVIGQTQSPLHRSPSGRFDGGAGLDVKLLSGALSSVDETALFSGANLAAIGDGSTGAWEVFQFGHADLVDQDTFRLTHRLRGQLGTDALMPDVWPEGSWFVLLNGLPEQIDVARNLRRVSQTYRIGPARRAVNDPSYIERTDAFDGNGLRPYSPAHLSALRNPSGGLECEWVRRTRIDGDGWDTPEVPLGEESESYLVQAIKDEEVLREVIVSQPQWIYPLSEQASDGLTGSFELRVCQISAAYGPGLAATLEVSG